jgi:hypothetical protein
VAKEWASEKEKKKRNRREMIRHTEQVITPSFPTFSIALAIKSPISRSPLAEIVPT